jgi:hypothetical protein
MKKSPVKIFLVIVVVIAAIQFIPVERTNPPIGEDISVSSEVKGILKRACYDCHSHETIWPWYSQVAPASWLLAWDVAEGREELNFSTWNRYSPKKQDKIIKEIWKEVQEGEMPPWFYLPLHPKARLSDNDRNLLETWARGGSVWFRKQGR